VHPWNFLAPGQFGPPLLALGSNNKYSNKIIAKFLHFSTETYNNEQVSKVFKQNFSRNVPENQLFWYLISPKSPNVGGQPPDPRLDLINREFAKTLLLLNIFDADAWQFWSKSKLYYFIFSEPFLFKNRFCTTEGANINAANKLIIFQKKNGILLTT